MSKNQRIHHRSDLKEIARRAMVERGLEPGFAKPVEAELDRIAGPAPAGSPGLRDLRSLLWCSIDNDDSRDLDQLSVSQASGGAVRILVAVADVDAVVKPGMAIDQHARHNTTSVYTAAEIFPMLPEKLSTDLTSLNEGEDRLSFVIDMAVEEDGSVGKAEVYRAAVRNRAKLAYDSVSDWLEGNGPAPDAVTRVAGLDGQLRVQDDAAQRLRRLRFENGALDLETLQPKALFEGETVVALKQERHNRARQLIEDFMIACNGVTARYLEEKKFPSLRRVVRSPERWQRIVELAKEHGERLPPEPDSKALSDFLARRRKADPDRFPDLSLVVVKLMGRGEYVVERPGQAPIGHFGLAVRDYTHSTAPNRRFPDLITQRLLKAALAGAAIPYGGGELGDLAVHCTEQEDAADKVERQVRKSAAALLLERRIGERFDAIVTGAGEKGTWVRVFDPPVEGKLVHGFEGLTVGKKLRVKLITTDVERGFIDFV
ncbi:MAG TPA: RNB domain-containing ribonuclease, partial [Thermoanaerobaculia bacterium]|nr:RNB domain-containing ribonuclease [Thermoanaerobaculia bacterium]